MSGQDDHRQRWIYGRRRGKPPRAGRQAQLSAILPKLEIDAATLSAPISDPGALFASPASEIWLEIGFGAGEHLAQQAAAHPDVGFIGCEPYLAGVARLISHVEEERLGNVRVLIDDAGLLLPVLPEASLARAFLLFPDPWPKRRHHKRRFVSQRNRDAMARVLADDAEWRMATDDMGYCRWMLAQMTGDSRFSWMARSAQDWRQRTDDWPPTRYEQKALSAGRPCAYLRFRRCPRSPV